MFALFATLLPTLLFTPNAIAQDDTKYTVWSSVIFSRTGERTPSILGDTPMQLTSVGALQQQSSGSFFRDRYLESFGGTSGLPSEGAPIAGLNVYTPDQRQLYIFGLDMQISLASAQAFMQGFYPPFQLTSNNTEVDRLLDPTNIVANGTYVWPTGFESTLTAR